VLLLLYILCWIYCFSYSLKHCFCSHCYFSAANDESTSEQPISPPPDMDLHYSGSPSAAVSGFCYPFCPPDTVSGLLPSSGVCLCLSVTLWYCVKTAEPIVEFFSPSGSPATLVLPCWRSLGNFNGVLPQGALNRGGVGQNCILATLSRYISQTARDRAIVTTLQKVNRKSHTLRTLPYTLSWTLTHAVLLIAYGSGSYHVAS